MLGPEITARLLETRANAAADTSDWPAAIELYQAALAEASNEIAPEPLFRLYLLDGDTAKAGRFLQENTAPLPARLTRTMQALVTALLERESPSKELQNVPPTPAEDPVQSLYWGLLLEAGGSQESALPFLYNFLTSRYWGKELASKAILRHYQPVCRMCREARAEAYDESMPVCQACADRLGDQLWKDQAIYAPSVEQERLLQNAWGPMPLESIREVHQVNTPPEMHSEIPYSPQLPLPELLERLDSDSQQAWESALSHAQNEGRSYRGINDLAIALCEKSLESGLFERKKSRRAALREAKALPSDPPGESADCSDELRWLLQVARWQSTFYPPFDDCLTVHRLWSAFQLTRPRPDLRSSTAVFHLLSNRLGAEQSDYFETLSMERPEDVFLHIALSGRSYFDFRPLLRERRLRHGVWLIEHTPTTQAFTLRGSDPEGIRAKTEAWYRQIGAHPDNATILGAAAAAFQRTSPYLAQALFRRCLQLEPDNKIWIAAQKRAEDSLTPPKSVDRTAEEELAASEAALAQDGETHRSARLAEIVLLAYKAGETQRARELTLELSALTESEDDEFSGFAFHIGHTVSGLLAFDEGDYKLAQEHLIQSGLAWSSTLFSLLGPSMSLAKTLLDLGESGPVLHFLESCKTFWDHHQLDLWKTEIEEGKKPDFGPNLRL